MSKKKSRAPVRQENYPPAVVNQGTDLRSVLPDEQKNQQINPNMTLQFPGMQFTSFRSLLARESKVEKNLLVNCYGGHGDEVCAIPTVEYMIDNFKDVEISVATHVPEFFGHLKLKNIYDLNKHQPFWQKYFMLCTGWPPSAVNHDFFRVMRMSGVDYCSLMALGIILPMKYKEITIPTKPLNFEIALDKAVIIHPGSHWAAKNLPSKYYEDIIEGLIKNEKNVVLVGKDCGDGRATQKISHSVLKNKRVFDLRDKTSLSDLASILAQSKVLLTNDSLPLHLGAAVSKELYIGFFATSKEADYLYHYRTPWKDKTSGTYFGYHMENFALGGIYDLEDICPNKTILGKERPDMVDEKTMRSWLPEPQKVIKWALEKI